MDGIALLRKVEEERRSAADHVLSGAIKDFAEYRYHLGKIRALEWVLDTAKERRDEGNKD